MTRAKIMLAALALLGGGTQRLHADMFTQVNFSNQANFTWNGTDVIPVSGEPSTVHLPGAPGGATTLGGIPFDIVSNANGKQAWAAGTAAPGDGNSSVVSITMGVNVFGVTDVYTLINTWWGQPGIHASLVFIGSSGANYTKDLVGNVDIRDYNQAGWTNTINGTTTTEVFTGTSNWNLPGRLDMQHVVLPTEFASQYLTSIQLIDSGASVFQRTVLDGVTVLGNAAAVPEPSSLVLLGLGVLGVTVSNRRRWRASLVNQ